jgi:hypothetical protein
VGAELDDSPSAPAEQYQVLPSVAPPPKPAPVVNGHRSW